MKGAIQMPVNLRNRHLISLKHHTPAEIEYLLDLGLNISSTLPPTSRIKSAPA